MATVAGFVMPLGAEAPIPVHHRVPGWSVLALRISLCPECHAKVHRTRLGRALMVPLLLELWSEQDLRGHEQPALNFLILDLPAQQTKFLGAGDSQP